MDLEQLRTLQAVAAGGSLSAAARERHLTQPAVSLQMKALEEDLGVPLLHRQARGVRLTEAGEAVLGHARQALAAVRAARSEAAQVRGLERGTLRLGATDAAATELFPPVFAGFHRAHPGIEVQVEIDDTAALVAGLRAGRLDLGLGTLPVRGDDITAEPVHRERMVLTVPAGDRRRDPAAILEAEPFIAYPREANTRRLVDAALAGAGLTARPVMEIGRPEVMARLVEAGVGVSVLPESVLRGPAGAGLRPVAVRRVVVHRELGLLLARRMELEPAARAFVGAVREAGVTGRA